MCFNRFFKVNVLNEFTNDTYASDVDKVVNETMETNKPAIATP